MAPSLRETGSCGDRPNKLFRVLIAHQSTIPHYRIPFYELLERRRPKEWTFDVIYDTRETERPRIYVEPVNHRSFQFPILDTRTTILPVGKRRLIWQHFLTRARHYDVMVTDTHMTNISYPLSTLFRLGGAKHIFWGHLRDRNVERYGFLKQWGQHFKLWLIKRSDFFFAYTDGDCQSAIDAGYPAERIFTLHNTIDLKAERKTFERLHSQRESIREQMGLAGKRVMIYVGRLHPLKRIPFLLESFKALYRERPDYHLIIVGGGPLQNAVISCQKDLGSTAMTVHGPTSDQELLGQLFMASDAFVITGFVGLAPLQALCYDLPIVAFDLPTHSPEIEYLTSQNSLILPKNTTSQEFADWLPRMLDAFADPNKRTHLYPTIQHLTLESMVHEFIRGINAACGLHGMANPS